MLSRFVFCTFLVLVILALALVDEAKANKEYHIYSQNMVYLRTICTGLSL